MVVATVGAVKVFVPVGTILTGPGEVDVAVSEAVAEVVSEIEVAAPEIGTTLLAPVDPLAVVVVEAAVSDATLVPVDGKYSKGEVTSLAALVEVVVIAPVESGTDVVMLPV